MFMCVLLLYTLYMSGMLRHRGCRKPLCVYVCSIIIHIIYEWHAEALRLGVGRREDSLQLKNGKKWVGNLHPLYLKIG